MVGSIGHSYGRGVLVAVVVSASVCLLASPYLARLTLSVPDREDARWWRGRMARLRRKVLTAGIGLGLGILAAIAAGWTPALPAFVLLALVAAPLIVIDVEHHRLPDRLVAPLAIVAAALLAVTAQWWHLVVALSSGAVVFAALFALSLIGQFGFGDVKLGGVLGMYLGWLGSQYVLTGLVAGFVLGGLASIALLLARAATRKSAIAFGPWLILGAMLAPLLA